MNMNPVATLSPTASLRGLEVLARRSSNPIAAFLGVPFAQPPIGRLRFAPPVPLELWTGVKDATKFGPICPQSLQSVRETYRPFHVEDNMSEDCLYLNIWTPEANFNRLRPVMVWFYGGAFVQGLSNYFDGTAYSSFHDVVFVSFNYRVGPFGFLATEDGHVKGNMGILDQLEALRWIKKHIKSFGGDPDNVTVFGESAGAICISLHLLSPLSNGLFHRAILQSGSSCYYSAAWRSIDQSKYVVSHLNRHGAEVKNGREIVEFLSDKSSTDIVKMLGEGFNPTVDGVFLSDVPLNLYRSGKFNPIDVIIGFNTNEGMQFIERLKQRFSIFPKESAENLLKTIVFNQFYRGRPNADEIYRTLHSTYIEKASSALELQQKLVEVYGDILFILPALTQASLHSQRGRTYLYQFDHRPFFSHYPSWVVADHGNEIPYTIGEPFLDRMPDVWSEEERMFSSMILSYWSNFARTGDPNDSSLRMWPRFDETKKEFMVLRHQNHLTIDNNFQPEKLSIWNNRLTSLTLANSKL